MDPWRIDVHHHLFPPPFVTALREHERIADAVDAGDQVAAAELVLRHMQGSHAYMSTLDAEKPVLASTVHRRL